MSIFKLNKDYFELTQLELNPYRTFNTSSIGTTGTIDLYYGKSTKIKDLKYNNNNKNQLDESLKHSLANNTIFEYLNKVKTIGDDIKYLKDIKLETPGTSIKGGVLSGTNETLPDNQSRNSYFKSTLENLNYYYKTLNSQYSYSISNYFSLNFFTIDDVSDPNDRALIYLTPSLNRTYGQIYGTKFIDQTILDEELTPFTLDLYLNPRYTNISGSYNPGCIFQVPGILTLSLIDGKSYDINQNVTNFKLLLQIGEDSLNLPSNDPIISSTTITSSLSLEKDYWYRITIRWGGEFINNSTGSIYINDSLDSEFHYSNNIIGTYGKNNIMPICVGNFASSSNPNSLIEYFNSSNAELGITNWFNTTNPTFNFTNQLNAELHHILFSRICYTDDEILSFSNKLKNINKSFDDLNSTKLISGSFSLQNSNLEINNFFNNKDDDILYIIPSFWYFCKKKDKFKNIDLIQTTPYNLYASFNNNIHSLNIENFVFNFASRLIQKSLPYMNGFELTAANTDDLFYNNIKNRLRNLLLLPCDDGNFLHDSSFITNQIYYDINKVNPILKKNLMYYEFNKTYDELINVLKGIYSNEEYNFEPGFLNLKNNLHFNDKIKSIGKSTNYLNVDLSIPTNLTNTTDNILQNGDFLIYKNTSFDIYNQFKFFNISNLYFGSYIKENSVTINDNCFSDFLKIKITIRDNGEGVLYRSDSKSQVAKWSKIGNLYQNEGFITILSPSLYRFGKNNFSISLNGTQNLYIYKITALIPDGKINKSLNSTWTSTNENNDYVYITDINLHDNNYNVIMKAKLAQPLYKSKNDKFMIRLKYDF